MNVVIPYKIESNNGEELRFAIRSLVKHFIGMGKVILVTDQAPDWYKGEVIFCKDIEGRKEYSIYNKLIQVQGLVLFTNDDLYANQDFTVDLPNYYSGNCRNHGNRTKTYKDLYRACLPDWKNYDIHTPMIINTTHFEWFIDRPIKTYYGNQHNVIGTEMEDVKIKGDPTYSDIMDRIRDKPFFSTKDNVFRPGVNKVLNELYPIPSNYE